MAALMLDYIHETKTVLKGLIERRGEMSRPFVEAIRGHAIKEIYITGSGTSYHAGEAARPYLELLMGCRVTPLYPTHFKADGFLGGSDSILVGISQSGQSTSTVHALDAARSRGMMTVAVSDNTDALVFDYADAGVLMGAGEERSGAKTKGYACSVAALWVMFTELARANGMVHDDEAETYCARMMAVANNLPSIIDASLSWYDRIAEELEDAHRMYVVGYPPYYGDVLEGALKLLETIRQSAIGYDTEEFLHGIYNAIDDSCHLFYMLPEGPARNRTIKLSGVLSEWTQHNYRIGASDFGGGADGRDLIAPFIDDALFSMLEYIIPFQVIACMASQARGINPDVPRDPTFHVRMGSKRLDKDQMVFGAAR